MAIKGKSIISIDDISKEDIIQILETAKKIEKIKDKTRLLHGKIMASLFFEPSTRTRNSFEAAANGLGMKIIGFSDPNTSSVTKGETIHDTIKMIENYADIIVMRHFLEGAPRAAELATKKSVINCGDGANQHPTQTLLDLYTIKKTQGKISGINIAMVGDLKYGRTVHSLASALCHFGARFYFVAPKELQMPKEYLDRIEKAGLTYSLHEKMEEVINNVDILYCTRIQKERFPDPLEYERLKNVYILRAPMLKNARDNMKILHPLPRVNEIEIDVDQTKHAHYFEQAANGVPIRQTLLLMCMGKKV